MNETNKLLNPKETQLIQHLIAGLSVSDAAKAMDIDYQAVNRWLKRPHVQAAYRETTKDITTLVRKQIESLSSKAIESLKDSLDSPSHLAKIQAIKIVLDRLDPETLKIAQPEQPEQVSIVDPALLGYIEDAEMKIIDEIIERARDRKQLAEEKITPMRRQA